MRDKDWIQTFTGKRFEIFEPTVEQIDVLDIAHHLAAVNRYTGATKRPYNVAEHCVRVSFRCAELAAEYAEQVPGLGAEEIHDFVMNAARWGLLHDAAEAYLNDVARPLKHQPEMAFYRELEKLHLSLIAQRFGLGPEPAEIVSQADDELLWTEVRDLMQPLHPDWRATAKSYHEPLAHVEVACWAPEKAERIFLKRFDQLGLVR